MRKRDVAIGLLCAVLAGTAACDKTKTPNSELDKNIEKSVGSVQSNTGMLGGNDAPIEATARASDAGADADRP